MSKWQSKKTLFQSPHWHIEEVEIEGWSHSAQISTRKDGAMVVPLDQEGNVLFVREYFAAIDRYEICLPKGKIDSGDPEGAITKELQEEIGYRPGRLDRIAALRISPGYESRLNYLFLARDLEPSCLEGDEHEPLEIVPYPLDRFEELIDRGELTEARAIAGLYLVRRKISRQ